MKKIIFILFFMFLAMFVSCAYGSYVLKSPAADGASVWKNNDDEAFKISITVDSNNTSIMVIDDGNISKRFICGYPADVINIVLVNENNELIGDDGNFYEKNPDNGTKFYSFNGHVTKNNKKEYEFYFDKKEFYEIFYGEIIDDESTISFHLDRVE